MLTHLSFLVSALILLLPLQTLAAGFADSRLELAVRLARPDPEAALTDAALGQIEHLDATGAVLRRVLLSDFREVDGYPFAHTMKVEDLERERTTVATASEVAFDRGLDDELFTVTSLSRP